MKTSSLRLAAVVVTIAPLLAFCPTVASGATVTVTVGDGGFIFSPSSVTIQRGDTVQWTWSSSFHSSTSGSPGSPNGIWDSGILNQGATFTHTFDSAGSFPYFCTVHGQCCGMTGTVNVASACTPPPANMVAWWPGDGNARDIQNADNGTLQGGATFAPGKVGQAFSFDAGSNSGVLVPSSSSLNPTEAIAIDAWINPSSFPNTAPAVVRKDTNNVGTTQYDLDVGTGVTAGVLSCSIGGVASASGGSVPLNQWSHVACTYDRQNIRIYINGVEVASAAATLAIPASAQNLAIGKEDGFTDRNFDGLIDEVEVFSRALSQPEIAAIFNADAAGKCKPPQPAAAFSRKTHGGAGTFDIDLMPNGTPGIECRSGGATNDYQMIFNFANPVTVGSASVTSGTGSVSNFSVSGSEVTVNLTGVTNVQRITLTLFDVNDGTNTGDVPVSMGVLIGDVNGNATVNASDVSLTKSQVGQAVSGSNFREDVNANGTISATDVALVKSKVGTALPP